jgi:hypothetical protein
MPRFSISVAMTVVALAAANCAIIRLVVPFWSEPGFWAVFLLGLLPLVDAQIISVFWLFTAKYRIYLQRRRPRERVGFGAAFAVVNTLMLFGLIVACVFASTPVVVYMSFVAEPVLNFVQSVAFPGESGTNSPMFKMIVYPLLAGTTLSGPPLLFGLAISWAMSRYKLIVERRTEPEA